MAKDEEDGFHALLGIGKEKLFGRYQRGGLESELESAVAMAERSVAKVAAVRALISKFPELIEQEKKYVTVAENHHIYPANPNRGYQMTDPEGCPDAIGFCDFESQDDFDSVMKTATELKLSYQVAQNKCSKWELDIRKGVPHIDGFKPNEREWRERITRAEKIGSEATHVIPELISFLNEDIETYLRSAKVKGLDTREYFWDAKDIAAARYAK